MESVTLKNTSLFFKTVPHCLLVERLLHLGEEFKWNYM